MQYSRYGQKLCLRGPAPALLLRCENHTKQRPLPFSQRAGPWIQTGPGTGRGWDTDRAGQAERCRPRSAPCWREAARCGRAGRCRGGPGLWRPVRSYGRAVPLERLFAPARSSPRLCEGNAAPKAGGNRNTVPTHSFLYKYIFLYSTESLLKYIISLTNVGNNIKINNVS